jgi:hypothetical protein
MGGLTSPPIEISPFRIFGPRVYNHFQDLQVLSFWADFIGLIAKVSSYSPFHLTMEEPIQNANPTVLLASDLPSRKPQNEENALLKGKRLDGGTGLFDATGKLPTFLYDSSSSHSDAGSDVDMSEDDDADVNEEIDEQEIYGMLH